LYVAGGISDSVVVFTRNTVDGKLTFLEYKDDNGLGGARDVQVSADGAYVYVTGKSKNSNALVVFSRNPTSGRLLLLQSFQGSDEFEGLRGPEGLALSP